MKFNIGDIITGVEHSPYTTTNSRGIYEVIFVYNTDYIRVRIVKHIDPLKVHCQYDVFSKFFVYAEGFVHWEGIFNKAYREETFGIKDGVPVVEGVGVNSPCYKQLCSEYNEYMKKKKEKNENALS